MHEDDLNFSVTGSGKKRGRKSEEEKALAGGYFGKLTTTNGYLLAEVVSAMIKELRRGNAMNAMYWAEEMSEKFSDYMWRRLMVFASEDVGTANNAALPMVVSAYQAYKEHKASPSKQQFVGHAILVLAESPKNREVDDFLVSFRINKDLGKMYLEIPDYALDGHTERGRQMGRGDQFLIEHAMVVDPKGAEPSRWLDERKRMLKTYTKTDWDACNPEKIG